MRKAASNAMRLDHEWGIETPRFVIIDGHAYAYRSFYAIRNMHDPYGRPTNAIFGFIKALAKVRNICHPTHLAVVWDGGMAQERLELLPEYKAQRPPIPEALALQLPAMMTYLDAAHIASWQAPGVEADDLIATQAAAAAREGAQVIIASSDKDFMQLVSRQIHLLNPGEIQKGFWGPEQVRQKTGVDPEQIVDWLSLIGDVADNIPGVAGIGPVYASRLLNEHRSIERMFERLEAVHPEALRSRLASSREVIMKNRELIQLKQTVENQYRWNESASADPDSERMQALFNEWGFKSLIPEPAPPQLQQVELF